MERKTTEEFIKQAIEIRGNLYDYSLVKYINNRTNVKIICKEHGVFEQQPLCHIVGAKSGCPICAKNKKLTTEDFIKRANKIHKNKFDYSLVNYIDMKIKVKIICPIHGVFEQQPASHISNYNSGCSKCFYENKYISFDNFIKRAVEIHKNKFDYSLVILKKTKDKIKIICPIHGIFKQITHNHLNGKGCKKCQLDIQRLSKDEFTKRAIKIHNNIYDYSLVEFHTMHDKIKIICPIHGIFEQNLQSHLRNCGCSKCNNKISKGENLIIIYLETNKIIYETQKTFNNCKHKQTLRFDFYLPDYNLCIEYDGIQHFKSIKYFGGNEKLKLQILRDNSKNIFCEENNIKLIRISYLENINEKLNNIFNL